jgi:hypothetical protein
VGWGAAAASTAWALHARRWGKRRCALSTPSPHRSISSIGSPHCCGRASVNPRAISITTLIRLQRFPPLPRTVTACVFDRSLRKRRTGGVLGNCCGQVHATLDLSGRPHLGFEVQVSVEYAVRQSSNRLANRLWRSMRRISQRHKRSSLRSVAWDVEWWGSVRG